MDRHLILALLLAGLVFNQASVQAEAAFQLQEGDRVAFLGGGIWEQDRTHGFLETRLTRRFPEAHVLFRNFGWGGDTVRGIARTSGYQNPEGFARLLKEVLTWKPTVVVLGYGLNESFAGPEALPGFVEDYRKLLEALGPLKARCVLLSPTYHEDLGRPLPDPTVHNQHLQAYTAAIKQLAADRKYYFIDLFHPLRQASQPSTGQKVTTNGIQLSALGYSLAAKQVEEQLGLQSAPWRLELDAAGKVVAATGTKVEISSGKKGVQFRCTDDVLPAVGVGIALYRRVLAVRGLPPGDFLLTIDGQEVLTGSAQEWQQGIVLRSGPEDGQAEKLLAAIRKKNDLWYRRWRPFNDHSRHWTYLRGDYQLYDEEIAALEKTIAQLRRPVAHHYALILKGKTP